MLDIELMKGGEIKQWRKTKSEVDWDKIINWITGSGTVGGWNEREADGRKKRRSLLCLVTLTRSCCAQCQSIRHPALLLMSTGNKSEEARLYFAAWVTCRSRHGPMCPCIPRQLTSPGLSFTRWESFPPPFYLIYSLCGLFYLLLLCQSPVFTYYFSLKCLLLFAWQTTWRIYALDKFETEVINQCHVAAQHGDLAARASVPCTSSKPFLLNLTSMNFKLFQYIYFWQSERVRKERLGVVVGDDDKHVCAFAIWVKECLHVYKWKIQWYDVSFHISLPPWSLPADAAPLR